ncbi:MAG: RluA family pseudouridine synthase [Spirochaetales bacterium]|nr:RluA family pseudouridine synthase [Spirochaetales bacterium]
MISHNSRIELPEGETMRVDSYVSDELGLLSRSQFKQRELTLKVNGKDVKLSRKVVDGDLLELEYSEPIIPDILPDEIPLDILFENDDVLVVNKPQGVVVHPAAGHYTGTLVQGLMYRYKGYEDEFQGETIRPGIVHRLDKDTSGVIITAKNPEAQEFLSEQFREKTAVKKYMAVCKGNLYPMEGRIKNHLIRDPGNRKRFTWNDEKKGKHSCTDYRVMKNFDDYYFVSLMPKTGRTHQLRVHMLSLGHPILGDPVYSRKDPKHPVSLMLHALTLSIRLPGEDSQRTFHAPLPDRFKELLHTLSGKSPHVEQVPSVH